MKKLALVMILCFLVVFAVGCDKNTDPEKQNPNKGVNVTSNQTLEEDGVIDFSKPDFKENSAGFEVVKDPSLSEVTYDGIHLISDNKVQLDLNFDDGKQAILTITGSEYFFDETESTAFPVLDNSIEVNKVEGEDGFNQYYWTKDYTYYVLSTDSTNDLSNEQIEKVVGGFSIIAGDNY